MRNHQNMTNPARKWNAKKSCKDREYMKHTSTPDPSWNASEREIPNTSFESAPIASQSPATNSTTPVHATWNDLLPGMYQNPQAPCAGIIFSNPARRLNGNSKEETRNFNWVFVLRNNDDLHRCNSMLWSKSLLPFSPSFIEKWDNPAAINIGPKIGHVIIQVLMASGKECFRASTPVKVGNWQR